MSSVCAEQHKLLLSLKKYQSPRDNNIDDMIPPRKLLTREAFSSGDGDGDPYSSDHFRMFEFKIRRSTRSRSHDWTDCPFAHPGEKARRRDPRRFHYSGAVCPEYRRGNCARGDACEFSHGVFECWLHPARYRTEACKDGKNCKRKVCFFAHSPRQLRVLPPDHNNNNNNNNCCSFCQHCSNSSPSSTNCSPTSTLFGVSHLSYSSPPLSPSSPPSLNDLISSLECLSYGEASSSPVYSASSKLPWLDVSDQHHYSLSPSPASSPLGCTQHQKQKRFNILSPTTVNSSASFSNGKCYPSTRGKFSREENKVVVDDVTLSAATAPDLGWVNDLLM